jgi:hypothetical protein
MVLRTRAHRVVHRSQVSPQQRAPRPSAHSTHTTSLTGPAVEAWIRPGRVSGARRSAPPTRPGPRRGSRSLVSPRRLSPRRRFIPPTRLPRRGIRIEGWFRRRLTSVARQLGKLIRRRNSKERSNLGLTGRSSRLQRATPCVVSCSDGAGALKRLSASVGRRRNMSLHERHS